MSIHCNYPVNGLESAVCSAVGVEQNPSCNRNSMHLELKNRTWWLCSKSCYFRATFSGSAVSRRLTEGEFGLTYQPTINSLGCSERVNVPWRRPM